MGQPVTLKLPGGHQLVLDPCHSAQSLRDLKAALQKASAAECERVVSFVESHFGVSLQDARSTYPYAEPMTWANVRGLRKLGMTIGNHTVTHPNLEVLASDALRRELQLSRRVIAEKAEGECRHFCYPYGAHSEPVCAAARTAGYVSAVTTVVPGWNYRGDDPFRLKRFSMPGEAYKLAYVLSGIQQKVQRWRCLGRQPMAETSPR